MQCCIAASLSLGRCKVLLLVCLNERRCSCPTVVGGNRFLPKAEERLLAVMNALLQKCYKLPLANPAEVRGETEARARALDSKDHATNRIALLCVPRCGSELAELCCGAQMWSSNFA
jgi:hypothetical protein